MTGMYIYIHKLPECGHKISNEETKSYLMGGECVLRSLLGSFWVRHEKSFSAFTSVCIARGFIIDQ